MRFAFGDRSGYRKPSNTSRHGAKPGFEARDSLRGLRYIPGVLFPSTPRIRGRCRSANRVARGAAVIFAALIAACGPPPVPPEGDLIGQANQRFENGDFVMAAQFYNKLLEQYPFSDEKNGQFF